MADRDALRAFQSRLASRLQAARSTGVAASWLAVEAGGANYLFPLGHAGEIFPWTPPQPVPYTEPWFLGVANLRGGLYGVVELAAFAAGEAGAPAGDTSRAGARLVALNELLEVNCALLIDRLVGSARRRGLHCIDRAGGRGAGLARSCATPMPQARSGRKSTCRRSRSNRAF